MDEETWQLDHYAPPWSMVSSASSTTMLSSTVGASSRAGTRSLAESEPPAYLHQYVSEHVWPEVMSRFTQATWPLTITRLLVLPQSRAGVLP
jgi:hypothetical protein